VDPKPATPTADADDKDIANYIADVLEWGQKGWDQVTAIGVTLASPVAP